MKAIDDFDLPGAAEAALELLRAVDAFIGATEPFQLAKQPEKAAELAAILYQSIEAIRIAGVRAASLSAVPASLPVERSTQLAHVAGGECECGDDAATHGGACW